MSSSEAGYLVGGGGSNFKSAIAVIEDIQVGDIVQIKSYEEMNSLYPASFLESIKTCFDQKAIICGIEESNNAPNGFAYTLCTVDSLDKWPFFHIVWYRQDFNILTPKLLAPKVLPVRFAKFPLKFVTVLEPHPTITRSCIKHGFV